MIERPRFALLFVCAFTLKKLSGGTVPFRS